MSGPKCDSYYVDSARNEMLLRARREAAESAARTTEQRLKSAVEKGRSLQRQHGLELEALDEAHPSLPRDFVTTEDFERYTSAAKLAVARIETSIGRAEGLIQLRELLSQAAPVYQLASWSKKGPVRQHEPEVLDRVANLEIRKQTVERILGRLIGAATENARHELQKLASELIVTENSLHAENMEAQLRLLVQQINDRTQTTQREKVEATKLLAELAGLQGDDVNAIRKQVQAVIDGQTSLARDLALRVSAVRKLAEKRMNDEYAGVVLREELERLGYSVGEDFSTLLVDCGQFVASRPDQGEYGVSIAVDALRGLMDMKIVRFSDGERVPESERRLRDTTAEQQWCSDHDRLLVSMQSRGIKGRTLKRLPAGHRAVPEVDARREVVKAGSASSVTPAHGQRPSRRANSYAPIQRKL